MIPITYLSLKLHKIRWEGVKNGKEVKNLEADGHDLLQGTIQHSLEENKKTIKFR